jgi:hypothetical protein
LIKGKDIVKYIKAQRIKCCEHLNRMEDIKLVKKITDRNSIGIRAKGQPKSRRRGEVINDLKKLKQRNWIRIVEDRKVWNYLVQKTRTHAGL